MKPSLKTLTDLDVRGKYILLRVDFNVPFDQGQVSDLSRIKAVLPTLTYLLNQKARVAIISHLGRPDGQVNQKYSLKPLIPVLNTLLPHITCHFAENYIDTPRADLWSDVKQGELILLENIRFHAGEEKNDPVFAQKLASFGDVYVNDAFAASHRAHASISGIAPFIPICAGLLLTREITLLQQHFMNPKRPLMAVIGGAKISSKIDILNALLHQVDILAIGGGMANTFLLAQGHPVGTSLVEEKSVPQAIKILEQARALNKEILLPTDVVTAAELKPGVPSTTKKCTDIKADECILDIGPKTVQAFCDATNRAHTLLWNGPLGAFEIEPFDQGTLNFARHIVERTREHNLVSLTGGGDSVAALAKINLESGFTYVSTGGGAFLEFLEGKTLPGLAVLAHDMHQHKAHQQ